MSFLYPLGFLALIGIPILILIYIIKNRYTEQTIAATYLWTLSEQFLKRRIPINRITGIINLILQILAVILISIILAHPVISLPNAANAYCFILDGSGSMNIVQDGKPRFDQGKEKIVELIAGSMPGSTYTLIFAGNTTDTLFENLSDKERAIDEVNKLTVAYKENQLTDAVNIAQRFFNNYPYALTYLVTDKNFNQTENVNLINVSAPVENYSLSNLDYRLTEGQLQVTGSVTSYTSDATLTLNLYYDGSDQVYATQKIEVKGRDEENNLHPANFEFMCNQQDFASIKVEIAEEDSLALDNQVDIFNVKHENISRTLLVSDTPFLMQAALIAAGNTQVDVKKTTEYDPEQTGYGLYIFESFTPEEMPREGAVWFVNPQKSIEGGNFSYQLETEAISPAKFSTSTSTLVRTLLEGVSKRDFELYRYSKLGLGGKFTTLISCDGNPILFIGTNKYGNREAVFAFDIKDSALYSLFVDSPIIVSNLLAYSFPEVINNTSYVCGETLQVNMVADCKSIRIESPLGNINYPDTSTAISEYELNEVGAYKVFLIMKDDSERLVNVYSSLPVNERAPDVIGESFIIAGTPEVSALNGIIDNLLIIFIILAVIAVADYGVYCYEQYQLR